MKRIFDGLYYFNMMNRIFDGFFYMEKCLNVS